MPAFHKALLCALICAGALAGQESGRAEWTGTVREPDGADYTLGLRLRLDGPPIESGQSLSLWSNQFFDLLPGELTNADFTILTSGQQPIGPLRLVAESHLSGN